METISIVSKLIDNTKTVKMIDSHCPWGLYIGELRHPDRGHLMPAVIKNKGAGFFLEYTDEHLKPIVHLIEDMVIHFVLATIERKRPVINVLDLSLNNPFVGLLQMSEICSITLHATTEELNVFNATMKQIIRHRNTEVLTSDVPSIAQYNEQCDSRAQESYLINIINFNDFAKNFDRLSGLSEILDNSEKVGIKFLFYVNKPNVDNMIDGIEDEKQRKKIKQLVEHILVKLPVISTNEHDIFLKTDSVDKVFSPLQSYIQKYGLTLELSSRGINKHIFNETLKDINNVIDDLEKYNDRPFLKIEIGVSPNGKTKRYFELGESNEAYHAFIIGKTGTGKTVFLDHIIKGIAKQFSPKEAELYLFDYKEGIGFAKYANLPHTRVLMLDHSNNRIIYTYIKQFQAMIAQRGELFTKNGVEKLSEYNEKNPDAPLSRVYLIIDEVQKLFKNDDSRVFRELIEDVARRGRSVGLTMIMATQTLNGYSIPDVILSQFGLKIAFRVDAQDSRSFFSIGNNSPIYLNKRECITNDREGVIEANKKVLVNAPVPDSIIADLSKQYPEYTDKVIINSALIRGESTDQNYHQGNRESCDSQDADENKQQYDAPTKKQKDSQDDTSEQSHQKSHHITQDDDIKEQANIGDENSQQKDSYNEKVDRQSSVEHSSDNIHHQEMTGESSIDDTEEQEFIQNLLKDNPGLNPELIGQIYRNNMKAVQASLANEQ